MIHHMSTSLTSSTLHFHPKPAYHAAHSLDNRKLVSLSGDRFTMQTALEEPVDGLFDTEPIQKMAPFPNGPSWSVLCTDNTLTVAACTTDSGIDLINFLDTVQEISHHVH
jgi:hypothetical protein